MSPEPVARLLYHTAGAASDQGKLSRLTRLYSARAPMVDALLSYRLCDDCGRYCDLLCGTAYCMYRYASGQRRSGDGDGNRRHDGVGQCQCAPATTQPTAAPRRLHTRFCMCGAGVEASINVYLPLALPAARRTAAAAPPSRRGSLPVCSQLAATRAVDGVLEGTSNE